MHTVIHLRSVRSMLVAAVAGGALLASATRAEAQTFGDAKTFTLGVERLSGFVSSTTSWDESPTVEASQKSTTFTLLPFQGGQNTVYSSPRLAFDYFVTRGLSLGGSFGFGTMSVSSRRETAVGSVETEVLDMTGFLIAPRIGYAIMFSRVVGIWPRGGITYVKASADGNVEVSALALTAEVPLVIAPTRNLDILISPTLDLGIDGNREAGNLSQDVKTTELGVQAGLGVYY